MDTEPESAFDDLPRLSALVCGTPTAFIGFTDRARTWIKSSVGLDGIQRPGNFGSYFTPESNGDLIIVPDASLEPKLAHHRLSNGATSLRFYASAPLLTDEGYVLGALCVCDTVPRALTGEQREGMLALARQVLGQLELHRLAASKIKTGDSHAVERRLVEEVALEHEKLYRELVEHNLGYIITHDTEGRLLSVNPAASEALGYAPAEMIGKSLSDFVTPSWAQLIEGYLARARDRKISEGLIRLRTKSGEELVCVYRGVCHDIAGDCPYILWFAQNITEFERADAASRLSEEPQPRSETLEAIQKLSGGVAHNLNNLMTVIILHSHLMLRHLHPDEPMYRHLAHARQAADRAALLIRQLLAFSLKQILQPKTINLKQIVEESEPQLREIAGDDIHLVLQMGASGLVKADPNQIEQVIHNLIAHAREALPDGGTLIIETEDVEIKEHAPALNLPAGRYVSFSVAHTGAAIDEDAKNHLFEPFHATKDAVDGLRLPAVYGIVKQSGGDITVSSYEGKGTTFKIYLPRVDDSNPLKETEDAS